MRVGLILFGCDDSSQPHAYYSKQKAKNLIKHGVCERVGTGPLRLMRELRKAPPPSDPHRFLKPTMTIVPRIKKPRQPETLLLQYPLKEQSSYKRVFTAREQRLWESNRVKNRSGSANFPPK